MEKQSLEVFNFLFKGAFLLLHLSFEHMISYSRNSVPVCHGVHAVISMIRAP